MDQDSTVPERFTRATGGFAFGGAVAGYFLLPVIRFAEPWVMAVAGLLIGWAIIVLYEQMVQVADPKKRKVWPFLLPLCFGVMFLLIGLMGAIASGVRVERVCYTIQQELLGERSPAPTKPGVDLPNAADRFQALGCHYKSSRPYSPLMLFDMLSQQPAQSRR